MGYIVILLLATAFWRGYNKGAAKMLAPFLSWGISFLLAKPVKLMLQEQCRDTVYQMVKSYYEEMSRKMTMLEFPFLDVADVLLNQVTDGILYILAFLILAILINLVFRFFFQLEKIPFAGQIGKMLGGIIKMAVAGIQISVILYMIELLAKIQMPAAVHLFTIIQQDPILQQLAQYSIFKMFF